MGGRLLLRASRRSPSAGALSARNGSDPMSFVARERLINMDELPKLFVCHGDDQGPRFHPCRRVQEALSGAGIEYDKVIAGHGHPIPLFRRGSRDRLRQETGDTRLPALKLSDDTVVTHSRPILAWVARMTHT